MFTRAVWDKAWPLLVKKTGVGPMLDLWPKKCANSSTLKSNEEFDDARNHAVALANEFDVAEAALGTRKGHDAAYALITQGKKEAVVYLTVLKATQAKWVAARLGEVEATVRGAVEKIEQGRERLKAAASLVSRRRADTERLEKELKVAGTLAKRIIAKAGLQKTLDAIGVIKGQVRTIGTDTRGSKAVEAVRGPGVAGVIKRAGLTDEQGKAMSQEFNKNMSTFVKFEDELKALTELCALASSEVESVMALNVRGIEQVEGALSALRKLAPNAKASCETLSKMLKPPAKILTENKPATVVAKFSGDRRMVESELQKAEDLVASVTKQVPALRAFIDGALKKIPEAVHNDPAVEPLMDLIMADCDAAIKEASTWKANMRPVLEQGKALVRAFEAARK